MESGRRISSTAIERIKGTNGENHQKRGDFHVYRRLRRNQNANAVEKRNWKIDTERRNTIQLREKKSDSRKISVDNCKEISVSEEKLISSSCNNVDKIRSTKLVTNNDEETDCEVYDEDDEEDKGEFPMQSPQNDVKCVQNVATGSKEIGEKQEETIEGNDRRNVSLFVPSHQTQTEFIDLQADIAETRSRLQNIVDLVMWRDISKSSLVFGFGTFILMSSSFAKDLNFSVISAFSYLGLGYLALIFVQRSILCRESIDLDDTTEKCILGEEGAVWLLKLVLPYINVVLFKLKLLFSGEPATTLKMALLLFVLARCGSSITVWTMMKLGFFGVFTIPRAYSSYSYKMDKYGKFWIRRFRDAWNSCGHKKTVAAVAFTLVWNLSSITARVCAVFFLLVSIKLFQESQKEEDGEGEASLSKTMEKEEFMIT